MKNCRDNFDIPMDSYDTSEIVNLIATHLWDTLGRIIDLKQVGLHSHGGIIFIPDCNGLKTSKIHEKNLRAFKFLGCKTEISSNLKIVNFFVININLTNNTFKPFWKDDHTSAYINFHSNHTRSIIQYIPNAVI